MLILSLPESLSVISTVSSAQEDMTIEGLDALIRAELDRKRNPRKPQRLNENSINLPKENRAERRNYDQAVPQIRTKKNIKKRRNCHYCGKRSHYKRACRNHI